MNSDHLTGFVVGVGSTIFAYHWYQNNRERVHEFLKAQEIGLAASRGGQSKPASEMTLEDLMAEKERLEDALAEKERKIAELRAFSTANTARAS